MKPVFIVTLFLILLLQLPLSAQTKVKNQFSYNTKLAEKYNLTIPDYSEKILPAPEWFQNLDIIFSDKSPTHDNYNKLLDFYDGENEIKLNKEN